MAHKRREADYKGELDFCLLVVLLNLNTPSRYLTITHTFPCLANNFTQIKKQ